VALVGHTPKAKRKQAPPKVAARRHAKPAADLELELTAVRRELEQALERQTATSDVLKIISRSTFDLPTVLEKLAESAVRLCSAERGLVFRFDGQLLRFAVGHNVSPEFRNFLERNPITPGRDSNAGRAALERGTVHNPDVRADPEYRYGGSRVDPYRTVLAVPMLRADELIGVFVIYRHEVRPFSDGQIALMETFADQAVIAIGNVRLLDELQQRTRDLSESLEQQTATSEVLRVVSSSPGELAPVFETMLANAARLCEAEFGVLSLYDGDAFQTVALHNVPPGFIAHRGTVIRPHPKSGLARAFSLALVSGLCVFPATKFDERMPRRTIQCVSQFCTVSRQLSRDGKRCDFLGQVTEGPLVCFSLRRQ
jgi:GAF domain